VYGTFFEHTQLVYADVYGFGQDKAATFNLLKPTGYVMHVQV